VSSNNHLELGSSDDPDSDDVKRKSGRIEATQPRRGTKDTKGDLRSQRGDQLDEIRGESTGESNLSAACAFLWLCLNSYGESKLEVELQTDAEGERVPRREVIISDSHSFESQSRRVESLRLFESCIEQVLE
jgi:hypothetical protein